MNKTTLISIAYLGLLSTTAYAGFHQKTTVTLRFSGFPASTHFVNSATNAIAGFFTDTFHQPTHEVGYSYSFVRNNTVYSSSHTYHHGPKTYSLYTSINDIINAATGKKLAIYKDPSCSFLTKSTRCYEKHCYRTSNVKTGRHNEVWDFHYTYSKAFDAVVLNCAHRGWN